MGNLYRYRLRFFALSHGGAEGKGPELRLWKDETRYRQVGDRGGELVAASRVERASH